MAIFFTLYHLLSSGSSSMTMRLRLIFFCVVLAICFLSVKATGEIEGEDNKTTQQREKRSYYGGFDSSYGFGGETDFWYAGRIVGLIAGILLLLFCCCIPCVCLAGVWFLGWFGFRQRQQRKQANQGAIPPPGSSSTMPLPYSTVYTTPPRSRNVRVDRSPTVVTRIPVDATSSSIQVPYEVRTTTRPSPDEIVYTMEDRYYTSSTQSPGAVRPDTYRSTKY